MFFRDLTAAKAALISGLLAYGWAQVDSVSQPSTIVALNDASDRELEAGQAFNEFSVALPPVLLARVQQVAMHGTPALMAEPQGAMKAREDVMIEALIRGLRLMGESFVEDTARIQQQIREGKQHE